MIKTSHVRSAAASIAALTLSSFGASAHAQEPPKPNEQNQAVLDKLVELGAKPLGTLSVEETRAQPTPADAIMALMEEKGIAPDPALEAINTEDIAIPGPGGDIPARIYTPEGGAIVVSADYRKGPENPFPAAHEDAYAAYEWAVENSGSFNGDADRMAVAGESAGANLAANVAIMARDMEAIQPVHQLLVYPVAGNDMNTESYQENANAQPLSKLAMEWFVEHAFESMDDTSDPRVNLVGRDDLEGLPSATVILAQIDPLRTEGETYAANLQSAGVEVEHQTFDGVTHEFFGMGAVVDEAKQATDLATSNLKAAFSGEGIVEQTGSITPAEPTAEEAAETEAQQ